MEDSLQLAAGSFNIVARPGGGRRGPGRRLVRSLKRSYETDYSSGILASTGRVEVVFLMREMLEKF